MASNKHGDIYDIPKAEPGLTCSACGVTVEEMVQRGYPRVKKFSKCGGCKVLFYCSREHQQLHWRAGHKTDCKKITKEIALLDKMLASMKQTPSCAANSPPPQEEEEEECPICLDVVSLSNGTVKKYTRYICCGKLMHATCSDELIASTSMTEQQKYSCVLCRTPPQPSHKPDTLTRLREWIETKDKAWAKVMLGSWYMLGGPEYLVKQNYGHALKLFESASLQGNMAANNNLGMIYDQGLGVEQSFIHGNKYHLRAAEAGFVDAQYRMGCRYTDGEGVDQNYPEALKWMQLAVKQEHPGAQYYLGNRHQAGEGVEKSHMLARQLWTKAAQQDYEPAIMKMKEGDETAFQNILSNPDGMATSDLMTYAFLNREGNERVGITQDFTRALKVFEKVAKQGMEEKTPEGISIAADAMFAIGCLYANGQVQHSDGKRWVRSFAVAREWFVKAAAQKHAQAAKELLRLDENGL